MANDKVRALQWFDRVDVNRNGHLDLGYLSGLSHEQMQALTNIIRKVDRNKDGKVSKEELMASIESSQVTMAELLAVSPEP